MQNGAEAGPSLLAEFPLTDMVFGNWARIEYEPAGNRKSDGRAGSPPCPNLPPEHKHRQVTTEGPSRVDGFSVQPIEADPNS